MQEPKELIWDVRYRGLTRFIRLTVIAAALCCLAITISTSPTAAGASGTKRITEIDCVVDDGRGVVDASGEEQPKFRPSVLVRDGMRPGTKIKLLWHYAPGSPSSLRVALDSPVPKGTRLVSITDDTVVAVLMTSDSGSTRAWLVTVNFRLERVMVSGMSSNTNTMTAQIITLSCTFDDRSAAAASKS